jgi:hypothetical protein
VRARLVLLLVLSLLWQGSWFAHASTPPCSMQEHGSGAPMGSGSAQCCDEVPPGTADACESWQDCSLMQSVSLLPAIREPAVGLQARIQTPPAPLQACTRPAAIWRPPFLS